jgi:DNA polymerase III subunit epsilon
MKLELARPIAFVDLETTGIDYAKDRIVEIAVVKVLPDGNVIEKSDRINPEIPIPPASSAIHGIKDEDVKDKPAFAKVAKNYFLFLENCDLAGYNSNRFDYPFLVEEFHRAQILFDVTDRKFVDVQRIFHKMEPRNLEAAYRFYCEKKLDGAHAALNDARATFEVLKSQLDKYGELKNDVDFLHRVSKDGDFADMGRRMYIEHGKEKFNFGKYKGQVVEEVFRREPQYYDWIMKADFPMDFKQKVTLIRERIK